MPAEGPGAGVRRASLGILLAGGASALGVLVLLELALARAHGVSPLSGGFGAVASPRSLLDPGGALAIVRSWAGTADRVTGLSANAIITRYAVTDALFATLLAVLLTRWMLPPHVGAGSSSHRSGRSTYVPAKPAAAYLFADWCESLYLAWVWDRPVGGTAVTSPSVASMALVGAFSTLKWITLGIAVAHVVRVRRRTPRA